MSWSNWKTEDIGLKVAGAPAVSSWIEGRLDVFVRTPECRLYHRVYENETWQGANWVDLSDGHTIEVPAAAVSWGPGRTDLFAVWDKQVHHRSFQAGAWSPWTENLGGVTYDGLAAASWKPERLDLLVRTADNFMSRRVWESGVTHEMGESWSNWENTGGLTRKLASAPAAVATGPSRIDHFGRGENGHLIHGWYQGVRNEGWEEIDNLAIKDAPAVVSGNTAERGRVDVFVRGEDDLLKHRIYYAAPQASTQTIYTVVQGDYLLKIARKFNMPLQALKDLNPQIKPPRYIIHPGDQIVVARFSPTPVAGNWDPGSGWEDLSANKIASSPAAVGWWSSNMLKRIDCFAQDASNNLIHTWWK
jgi:hypothetical protein